MCMTLLTATMERWYVGCCYYVIYIPPRNETVRSGTGHLLAQRCTRSVWLYLRRFLVRRARASLVCSVRTHLGPGQEVHTSMLARHLVLLPTQFTYSSSLAPTDFVIKFWLTSVPPVATTAGTHELKRQAYRIAKYYSTADATFCKLKTGENSCQLRVTIMSRTAHGFGFVFL